jgi:2-octaprenyl-6-methoxyphenol hydroxylase
MEPSKRRIFQKVVIAGSGPVGMLCALFLKKNCRQIECLLCDPLAFQSLPENDLRAFALTAQTKRILEDLGLWSRLKEVEPIVAMRITDSRVDTPMRRPLLVFDEPLRPGESFAYMVTHASLLKVLREACREENIDIRGVRVEAFTSIPTGKKITLSNGETLECALLIGADGAQSHVRTITGIPWIHYAYDQWALVTTLEHEHTHGGCAIQHFFPQGPFARLPLYGGHRTSLVWVEPSDAAETLLTLDSECLRSEIAQRVGADLGAIEVLSSVKAYPLKFGIARSFVSDRCALIGDSAHVIHPLAGQGVNLGFQDVLALGTVLADAVACGADCGDPHVLDVYERSRYSHTTALWMVTEGLNRLFSSTNPLAHMVRQTGLRIVNSVAPLKTLLIHQAAGTLH